MMYGWGYGNGYDLWGFITMLLMMALVIFGVIMVVRHLSNPGGNPHEDSALEALKKRYAKGEINKKEYEEIRKDILS